MMLRAEPARTHDLRGALDLLGRSELADQDVSQGWGHYFVVREDDGRVVGVAGLELHGEDGLLRSVAVDPDYRGQGLAAALVEGGVKTMWAGGRVSADAAVFLIDWNDLQMNLPNPEVPGQFYIANLGAARSSGLELELHARPYTGIDLYGTLGVTHARFGSGSASGGVDVSGNTLPNVPELPS
jgi:GNAT superfamily N-acetyltransferase